MRPRAVRLGAVALLAGLLGGAAPSEPASACSCALPIVVNELADADAVVIGRVTDFWDRGTEERIERSWLVEVDTRLKGDTPDVIAVDLTTEPGACDDIRVTLPSLLLLQSQETPGRYRLPACLDQIGLDAVTRYFDEVWAADGDGSPALVTAVDAAGHDLAVVDESSRVLRYLSGTGPTMGLAACPGGTHFLQLRGDSADRGADQEPELVRWRYDDWSPVEVIAIGGQLERYEYSGTGVALACDDPEGRSASVDVWPPVEVVDGAVTPSDDELGWPRLAGPEGRFLLHDGGSWIVAVIEDGDNLAEVAEVVPPGGVELEPWSMSAVAPTDDGWRVSVLDVRGTDEHVLVDIAVDGSAQVVARSAVFAHGGNPIGFVVDPAIRDSLTVEAAGVPDPLFGRSGERIDMVLPTIPTAVVADDGERAASTAGTLPPSRPADDGERAASTAGTPPPSRPADDGESGARTALVVAGGVLVGLVLAVGVWALRRRAGAARSQELLSPRRR